MPPKKHDSCLLIFQLKDPKLWRFYFLLTEYMNLGECLKEVWGLPVLKISDANGRIILLGAVP